MKSKKRAVGGWIFAFVFVAVQLLYCALDLWRKVSMRTSSFDDIETPIGELIDQVIAFLRYFLAGPSLVSSPSETLVPREIGGACLSLRTDMPYGGKAEISFSGRAELRLRVPAWQNGISLSIDQKEVAPRVEAGYIALELDGEHEISLNFLIRPRFVYANENVSCDCGRKAVEYGPLVLCGESVDNGGNLRAVRIPSLDGAKADRGEYFTLTVAAERLRTSSALYSYDPPVSEPCTLKLIPYFAWANRGKGDMQIWWL